MPRTMSEIANQLYGSPEEKAAVPEGKEPRPARTEEELAAAIYPDRTGGGRYPESHGPGAAVPDVIRSRDGQIAFQGTYSALNDTNGAAYLAAANSDRLQNCDLDGLNLLQHGVSLDGGNLTGCSMRGTRFPDSLSGCVLKDIEVSSETDIGSTDFMSCRMDLATWEKLQNCKGARSARNLHRPRAR